MNNEGSGAFGILIIAGVAAYVMHSGFFYQTGDQWLDTCWNAQQKRDPKNREEEAAWQQCEPQTKKAIFDAGFILGGNPESARTAAVKAVDAECPNDFTQIPMSGIQVMAVDIIQKDGGPDWTDKFLPPDRMIVRAFEKRWPSCIATRAQYGFPKLTPKGDSFDWAAPCKPCDAEIAARKQSQ